MREICTSGLMSGEGKRNASLCVTAPFLDSTRWHKVANRAMLRLMGDLLKLIWWLVTGFFRSRAMLEAEIVALRHQLNVLRRKAPKRLVFGNFDRLVFASLYWLAPGILNTLVIVKPETVIRWHRAGFRLFWRWKSRSRGGRPKVPLEIRQLIRDMSLANPLWGAPRIHGELLKLGIDVGQTSVAKYMARHRRPCPYRKLYPAGIKLRIGRCSASWGICSN
jgi:hypothetical protein